MFFFRSSSIALACSEVIISISVQVWSPFPSWTINTSLWKWEAPLAKPNDGKNYNWIEDNYQLDNNTGWVEDDTKTD